ncbi:MAG: CHAT domain-containing protein, partial [Acidobacteria bacterium]|nr:CHAT domain-containing protein [Acidobacteriota bacterium]
YAIPHHLAIEANLLARLGELESAERLFRKAADVTEGMVLNAASFTARRMVIGAMSEVYVGYFVLAADRLGDIEKAFGVVEEARGRVAADSLRSLRKGNRSVDEPPNALDVRIASLNSRLLDSDNPAERARLMDAIFEAEQELTPDGSPPAREKPVSLRRFQDDLEPQEVALEYVLSEPNSYCLVITRRHVRLVKLAGSRELKALVTEYRNAIDKKTDSHVLSQRLLAALLEPIREYHESRDVVIIPDGALNLIPFEGLRSNAEGYSLNRHSFTVAPSATVLHLLRTEQKKPVARGFLAVSASPSADDKKGKSGLGIFRGLLEFRRSDLAALPSTETEVKSIARMISGPVTTLMRDQATEAAFKNEPISAVQVMHLALHGLTDNAFPDRSALVFSAGGSPQEDGLLQAREIRKLPINAELVTLSACDAGTGRIEGQEGVASLVQAFLDTGAKSVVASLWPAEDTYTKGLMEAFYRHLARGESKREALRLAKIDMLGQFGDTVPPLYWAGFVLIGDGSGKIAFGGAP